MFWFDDAVCDLCGKQSAAHVVVTAPHAAHEWYYAIGVINLCLAETCKTEAHNLVKLRLPTAVTQLYQFVWYNLDQDEAQFRAMAWGCSGDS
jgi:hypothetical protein